MMPHLMQICEPTGSADGNPKSSRPVQNAPSFGRIEMILEASLLAVLEDENVLLVGDATPLQGHQISMPERRHGCYLIEEPLKGMDISIAQTGQAVTNT
jgi:hypothetical protein